MSTATSPRLYALFACLAVAGSLACAPANAMNLGGATSHSTSSGMTNMGHSTGPHGGHGGGGGHITGQNDSHNDYNLTHQPKKPCRKGVTSC